MKYHWTQSKVSIVQLPDPNTIIPSIDLVNSRTTKKEVDSLFVKIWNKKK